MTYRICKSDLWGTFLLNKKITVGGRKTIPHESLLSNLSLVGSVAPFVDMYSFENDMQYNWISSCVYWTKIV
jgi:hypothetical protein